jgi:hypothetical protein
MMLLCDRLGQRKTMMISSVAMMPAIAAGQPGNSIRTEPPLVLDKAWSRPDKKST